MKPYITAITLPRDSAMLEISMFEAVNCCAIKIVDRKYVNEFVTFLVEIYYLNKEDLELLNGSTE